jgi:hypothetical protein
MTNNANDYDFNTAGEQRTFDVIPAGTVCTLQMAIRRGGEGEDGWLSRSKDGGSVGLDLEYTIMDGDYANRKIWQRLTLEGTTEGHATAGEISRNFLRAVLESARGIRFDDTTEQALLKRRIAGWQDFNGLKFIARLGVEPAKDRHPAKNKVAEAITPPRHEWHLIEQDPPGQASPTPSTFNASSAKPAPANAIVRPDWASRG